MTSVVPTPEWQRLTAVLEHLFEPVVVLRPVHDETGHVVDFRYLHANRAACEYNSLSLEQTIGRRLGDVLPRTTFDHVMPAYRHVLATGAVFREEASPSFSRPRREFRIAESCCSRVDGDLVVTWRDHTDRVLEAQAATDSLTGLANRRALHDRLPVMLRDDAAKGQRTGVLFCDLDDFKGVNDRYGHVVGDAVLRVIAERLRQAVRSDDLVVRMSGDELLVVLADVRDVESGLLVAEKLRQALLPPIVLGDVSLSVTASFGLCMAEADESVHAIVQRADDAMYAAKRDGRNRVSCA